MSLKDELEAEGTLRESEERYRLLAEHSTDMISKHTPEGAYTYASPACRALLGYEPEELVGRDAYEFFHPDDLEQIGRAHSTILERPGTYTVGYRIRRRDGAYIWFETTSRTVRDPNTNEVQEIIAVSRDITERKAAEEQALFQAHLLEQVQAAVIATDMRAIVTHWNEHAERLYGWTREEALGRNIAELTISPEGLEHAEEIMEWIRSGETWKGEFVVRRKDGSGFLAYVTDSLIRDSEGRAVGIVSVSTDITERKRLEESLREIREAERRRIARDLHDVVLQDLAGALQGMQAAQIESGSGAGLEPEIAALRRAVGSLRNVIYDLRLETGQPFVRAVESLVELNRQLMPEREIGMTVHEGFPHELPDDVELLRVLQEALVNARRHSGARLVEVILSRRRHFVWAEVVDDGEGFDPASVREGVGISGMRERASALGGRLEIESSPGAGTSVKVEVPLSR